VIDPVERSLRGVSSWPRRREAVFFWLDNTTNAELDRKKVALCMRCLSLPPAPETPAARPEDDDTLAA